MVLRTVEHRPKGKTITFEQIASPARRPKSQEDVLKGMGLNKLRRRSTLENTDAVWGMYCKVQHMVRVVEDSSAA